MHAVLQDVRYGLRLFARNPGFTAVAVLTLALGIGTTTAIFSFVNAVLLRPLAFRDSRQLVDLRAESRTPGVSGFRRVAPGDFLEWRAQSQAFEDMAAFTGGTSSLTGGGDPERLLTASVTSRFFETLGVAPLLGGTFASHDGQADADQLVMISASLWQRRFRSDPSIVGKSITLDGKPAVIIGVMPRHFTFPRDLMRYASARTRQELDVWTPLALIAGDRGNYFLQVVARLKPDVGVARARDEMARIAEGIDAQLPSRHGRPNRGLGVGIEPLHDQVVSEVRPLLFVFLGAVGFLLLIACTNVANLLLGRAAARQREVAIRAALGSGRRRLIQQLLTESVLLGLLGGLSGLLLAVWCLDLAAVFIPPGSLPRLGEVTIDPQALAFTMAVSVITGLVFGLAPALQSSKTDVTTALKAAGTTQTARTRLLNVLVVSEVALAFVLLTGAGLMIKSFVRLTSVDPGFKPDSVLTVSVTLPEARYPTSENMRSFATDVTERLRRAPGVAHAGAVNWLPLGGELISGDFAVEDLPRRASAAKPAVSPDYFQAMAIPLIRGRAFNERDTDEAPLVVIVTDRLARQLWPGSDPLGKRLKLGFGSDEQDPWRSVVGVVGDVKQTALGDETRPAVYSPLLQAPRPFLLRNLTIVVRSPDTPTMLASVLRHEIRSVDPTLPFDRVQTLQQLLADSVSEPRFRTVVLGGFAGAALALVAIGVLGVLAYSVTRRTHEIGVRMALGAQRVDVLRMVVTQALAMAGVGIVLGALGALALTRLLTRFLFEVRPLDPGTFAAASVVLASVALVASYLPTRRATSVDPLIALRAD